MRCRPASAVPETTDVLRVRCRLRRTSRTANFVMLGTPTLRVESKSLVRILVPAGLVIMAVLVGRVHRLFWNDLAVSTVVILEACARTNSRRAQLVDWSIAICGVWLVIAPS